MDLAEDGLFCHLQEKAPWAIAFVLKSLGRTRGYGERPLPGTPPQGRDDLSEWPQIQYAILQALDSHPDAKWAVVEALKALEPHESQNGHHPSA